MTIDHELLARIEEADIGCRRGHYALLTEREAQERQYRSTDQFEAWTFVESRGGNRVGRILGLGLRHAVTRETLTDALEWLRAEKAKVVRIPVAPIPQNAHLGDMLREFGFDQKVRMQQWALDLRADPVPHVEGKRTRSRHAEHAIEIREITAEDADTFARIVGINYVLGKHTNLSWWARQVGAPGIHTFLAFDGDEPVGTGMLQADTQGESGGGLCVLGYGTTLKAYRKRGIQNAMIAFRLSRARELGYQLATAGTFGTDQSSRNLRRQGFVNAGEISVFTYPIKIMPAHPANVE